MLTFLMMTQ
jgi:hypothetical protein